MRARAVLLLALAACGGKKDDGGKAGPAATPPADARPAPLAGDVDRTLDNGLRLILAPVPDSGGVALLVLFRIGGDHDPAGQSGLAHLVEHMLVTAANPAAPARTADEWMKRYPLGWNAQTGSDYTVIDFVQEFQPDGPLVQQVEVPVRSDGIFEPSQNLFVDLLDASGLVVADGIGEGVIVDLFAQAVVTTTGDGDDGVCAPSAGGCTLREALRQANASAGLTQVRFAIPGSGVQRIQPTSPLPAVSAERITMAYSPR